MSVIKKPDLTDPKLRAKLAKGMGHDDVPPVDPALEVA